MTRTRKPKKEPIKAAERVVIEKWNEPKLERWQHVWGQRVSIGQYASGEYYLKLEKLRRVRRIDTWSKPPVERIYDGVVRSTLVKVGDNEVDSIMDGLITLKELIKSGRTVASTITKE